MTRCLTTSCTHDAARAARRRPSDAAPPPRPSRSGPPAKRDGRPRDGAALGICTGDWRAGLRARHGGAFPTVGVRWGAIGPPAGVESKGS
jgi:hypothetical protein